MTEQLFDGRAFRDAVGRYASGIAIISRMRDDRPIGVTCQSFYSVSLDPPLVSVCVGNSSTTWPEIRSADYFTINLLSEEQMETSNNFGRSGGDRWAGVRWTRSARGNPVLQEALLCLECGVHAEHAAGDHTIIVARVMDIIEPPHSAERLPLLYYKGRYRRLSAN